MNDQQSKPSLPRSTEMEFPEAHVRAMKFPFPFIWLVPLIAAACAGYLLYQHYQELGPKITVTFGDVTGIKPGETQVEYRGVTVGLVMDVRLDENFKRAYADIRLQRSAEAIAKKGTLFWIVRPEVGQNDITGLGTVFTGPYIDVDPGTGEDTTEFVGLEKVPLGATEKGLKIVLKSNYVSQVSVNSPVYYRGVQVGSVESIDISRDATKAEVRLFIKRAYARLVSSNSKFWAVGGADLHGSLFSGIDLKVESARALISGGVAFATPDDQTEGVKDGAVFSLDDKVKDEWLEWSPKIFLSENQIKQSKKEDDDKAAKSVGAAVIKKEK